MLYQSLLTNIGQRRQVWLGFTLAILCVLLAFSAFGGLVPVEAQTGETFTVDTFNDTDDNNKGDGICADADGNCSLRAAISESNTTDAEDTVILPPGTYTLSLGENEGELNRTGDLDINEDLVISSQNGDPTTTSIDANGNYTRAIHIGPFPTNQSAITVNLEGIRVVGGSSSGGSAPFNGGIFVENTYAHTVNLDNVILTDNEGYGVVADGATTVNISNSEIRNNRSGGVANYGTMTITNTTVRNNDGVGIRNNSYTITNVVTYNGTITINNSTISDNTNTGSGGGINSSAGATTSITSTYILRNTAGSNGGGIFVGRSITVDKSVIAANIAENNGGGIYFNSSNNSSAAIVTNSTISENISYGDSSNLTAGGGGFYNYAGRVTITNVTISGNRAIGARDVPEEQGRGAGGGFYYRGISSGDPVPPSFTELNNVTITNNRANVGGGYYTNSARGGNLSGLGVVRIENTIVAGNTASDVSPDCRDDGNDTDSLGYNILGNTEGCGLFNDPTDITTGGAQLSTLDNNGGPTCTHAIQSVSSTAVDAGNTDTCATNDQRGAARSNVCDIGAYEFNVSVVDQNIECLFGNELPLADDDTYETDFNTALTVSAPGLLLNDSDPDGDDTALTAILEGAPTNGTVIVNADGSFTYTPDNGYTGLDSFTYQANDGIDNSNIATVQITINAPNPVAVNDTYTVLPGEVLSVSEADGVLSNDYDPVSPSASLTTNLSQDVPSGAGTLVLNENGSFVFTPAENFEGTTTFTYFANNGTLDSLEAATVTINVTETAPTAENDFYTAPFNQLLQVPSSEGVLANDDDPNGDNLTASIVSSPDTSTQGSLTLNSNGSFSFDPVDGFDGMATFTYQASDGTETSNTAEVTITISGTTPFAASDNYSTPVDTELSVPAPGVLGNDNDPNGDPIAAELVTDVSDGSLTLNVDGSFTYTPDTGFAGEDSFTYKATAQAGAEESNIATVTITVSAAGAPTAFGDTYSTSFETTLGVPEASGVLTNDTDPDNDTLTVASNTEPNNGSLTLNSNGSFTYVPDAGFTGPDSFTYRATDGTSNSAEAATVTIEVLSATAPSATNDSYEVVSGTTLEVLQGDGVLDNDSDPNADQITATLVNDVTSGTLTLNDSGSFTYTPNSGFTGTDSFTYRAVSQADSEESNTATVTLTVTAAANIEAVNDVYSTQPGVTLTIAAPGVLENDTGSNITSVKTSDPSSGTLALSDDGSFIYIPESGFTGEVSFTYQVTNGVTSSEDATVTIAVTNEVTELVANTDNYQTGINVSLVVDVPGVLSNDTGLGTLTAIKVSDPTNGSLVLDNDGSFVYVPTPEYSGTDSFTYSVSNGTDTSTAATVTITVSDVDPNAPTANADTYTGPVNKNVVAVAPGVLSNDSLPAGSTDILTAVIATNPANGTVTLNADGSFIYTPNTDFAGTDSFTYTANADGLASAPATVTINLSATAPAAEDDTYSVEFGTTLTITVDSGVIANDSDPDGSVLQVDTTATVPPANGTLTLNTDGSFTYVPADGFIGDDMFMYQVSDGTETSNLATVTISVTLGGDLRLVSPQPDSTITDTIGNPTYRWPVVDNAFAYELYISPAQNFNTIFYGEVAAADHCDVTVCEFDPTTLNTGFYWLYNGSFQVWLKVAGAPVTEWRGPFVFTIQTQPASPPTITEPLNLTGTSRPTITWTLENDAKNASWFNIYVIGGSTTFNNSWHSQTEACGEENENGVVSCQVQLSTDLINFTYELYIGSWGPAGYATGGISGYAGPTSMALNSPVPTTTQNMTIENTSSGSPTLSWDHVPGASWYQVWVGLEDFSYTGHYQWYFAEDLNCETGTCTIDPATTSSIAGFPYTPISLPNSQGFNYAWYVQGWGAGGFATSTDGLGGWALGSVFTVP